jgi:hypothetical protein
MGSAPNFVPLQTRKVEIITGVRGPQHAPTAAGTFGPVEVEVPRIGERVFRARATGYRQHLGKRPDRWDNETGQKIPGFEFTAVFEDSLLRIPAYFFAHAIPEHEQAEFVRRLDTHPLKGIEFFDVADLHKNAKAAAEQAIRDQLAASPDLKRRLAEEFAAEQGFALPQVKTAPPLPAGAVTELTDADLAAVGLDVNTAPKRTEFGGTTDTDKPKPPEPSSRPGADRMAKARAAKAAKKAAKLAGA